MSTFCNVFGGLCMHSATPCGSSCVAADSASGGHIFGKVEGERRVTSISQIGGTEQMSEFLARPYGKMLRVTQQIADC